MSTDNETVQPPSDILKHYRRLRRRPRGGLESMAETAFESEVVDINRSDVPELGKRLRAQLDDIVKTYLGDKPELHELADKIASAGAPGLSAYADGNAAALRDAQMLAGLETIVRTDGTRPSFMIREGVPDLKTSPVSDWAGAIEADDPDFRAALGCVGRIDDPTHEQGFQGTGALIGPNLVLTNRHVAQAIAKQAEDGGWALKRDITIDFGHEFNARASINPRKVKGVVFAGPDPIDPFNVTHAKLDAALLELEPLPTGAASRGCLPLDCTSALDVADKRLFIVGYPGDPGYNHAPPTLLEKLFSSTFGCKRLAPGLVMAPCDQLPANPRKWSLSHDATTLGGNSGSAILIIGRYGASAGLHYGGTWGAPRENWCHVFPSALAVADKRSGKTLRETLLAFDVDLKF